MKTRPLAWWLFWTSFCLILYTYIGFPLLVAARGLLRSRPVKLGSSDTPLVSLIIAAYNEAPVIKKKIDNTLALDYPRDCLEIVVASDGCDDGTPELVMEYNLPVIKLLRLPRQGKNLTLNDAVAVARGDVLVFTDADSMLAPDSLRYLVAPLSDAAVGGVAGDYRHDTAAKGGASERTYWQFERRLKALQCRVDSMTSAWGPIFAIRRELFQPIPPGVTDDYFTSAQVLAAHRRLVFEPRAVAVGPVADSARQEFRRKVRIITAGLRGVWKMRQLFNPLEYGFLAVQIFSHKFLRRLMVIPLVLLSLTAPFLGAHGWFYKLAALGQFAFHGAAALGFVLRNTSLGQLKLLRLPFFFDMVYTAAAVALVNLFSGARHDIWKTQPYPPYGRYSKPGEPELKERLSILVPQLVVPLPDQVSDPPVDISNLG